MSKITVLASVDTRGSKSVQGGRIGVEVEKATKRLQTQVEHSQ